MHIYESGHTLLHYLYIGTYDIILYYSFCMYLEPASFWEWLGYPDLAYQCPATSGQG